jgi:hypothetical protein
MTGGPSEALACVSALLAVGCAIATNDEDKMLAPAARDRLLEDKVLWPVPREVCSVACRGVYAGSAWHNCALVGVGWGAMLNPS